MLQALLEKCKSQLICNMLNFKEIYPLKDQVTIQYTQEISSSYTQSQFGLDVYEILTQTMNVYPLSRFNIISFPIECLDQKYCCHELFELSRKF